jgi:hypothetical protein
MSQTDQPGRPAMSQTIQPDSAIGARHRSAAFLQYGWIVARTARRSGHTVTSPGAPWRTTGPDGWV